MQHDSTSLQCTGIRIFIVIKYSTFNPSSGSVSPMERPHPQNNTIHAWNTVPERKLCRTLEPAIFELHSYWITTVLKFISQLVKDIRTKITRDARYYLQEQGLCHPNRKRLRPARPTDPRISVFWPGWAETQWLVLTDWTTGRCLGPGRCPGTSLPWAPALFQKFVWSTSILSRAPCAQEDTHFSAQNDLLMRGPMV